MAVAPAACALAHALPLGIIEALGCANGEDYTKGDGPAGGQQQQRRGGRALTALSSRHKQPPIQRIEQPRRNQGTDGPHWGVRASVLVTRRIDVPVDVGEAGNQPGSCQVGWVAIEIRDDSCDFA